eukprot:TRINITY_DN25640_c0_g1_i1.p1 TRINITY_DN25640_c0_g1~~TRINITY_DN25640_c0_g1_i1.p1  ORF type:complete len:1691 (+),score=314.86 TRINITY_DN25640_c0_g1_i1:298-5370(+)
MAASLFSQPPVAYFQPLPSSLPNTRAPSFIACGKPGTYDTFGSRGLTEFETISSKVCDWAGELGKNHDLRQGADHCAWLFSEQAAPFQVSAELPTSALIPAAQRQPRVDFVSSATAMKSLFSLACDIEADMGVMVHRLGDWLVVDDGTEISSSLSAGQQTQTAKEERAFKERLRRAEQRHRVAVAHAEAVEAHVAEKQELVEQARVALWRAELEAQRVEALLQDAMKEVATAAGEVERMRAGRSGAAPGSRDITEENLSTPASGEESSAGSAGSNSCCQSKVGVDAAEDHLLYRNFIGHSIRLLQDESPSDVDEGEEPTTDSPAGEDGGSPRAASAAKGQELVPLDGQAAFRQVGVWKVADDVSVVVGSKMVCLGNAEHPKLTLYLHNTNVVSDVTLLEHWLECLIAGVPEFAICSHQDGAVQSYTLYKLSELWPFLNERLAIERKLRMTLEVLRWIKRQCCFEGCTYWLSKSKDDPSIKLFRLSGANTTVRRGARRSVAVPATLPPLPSILGPGNALVCKNTFLHVLEEDDDSSSGERDPRRSRSCPARLYGPEEATVTVSSELSVRGGEPQPLTAFRHRISALFFRRAVSSPPRADVARFFESALDLAAADATDHCGGDGRESMVFLEACCHLGLALCRLGTSPAFGDNATSSEDDRGSDCVSCDGTSGETFRRLPALLASLRVDAPHHCRFATNDRREGYRLWPLCGRVRRTPLLYIGLPPWPQRLQGAEGCPEHEVDGLRRIARRGDEKLEERPLATPSLALVRVADAFHLLAVAAPETVGNGLPDCDRERVEALAFPIAAVTLIRLASELLRSSLSPPSSPRAHSGITTSRLAWCALMAARRFAVLDSAHRIAEKRPFFSILPSPEELLVRVEHLAGGLLLAAPPSTAEDVNVDLDVTPAQIRVSLSQLEQWLLVNQSRVQAAMKTIAKPCGTSSMAPPREGPCWDGAVTASVSAADLGSCTEVDATDISAINSEQVAIAPGPAAPMQQRREAALWHYEQSVRLLPKVMVERGAGSGLLSPMMMALAATLVESVVGMIDGCDTASVVGSEACGQCLEMLSACDRRLARAEELAEGASHSTSRAVVQANRGQLRSLAADVLVSRALASVSGTLGTEAGSIVAAFACGGNGLVTDSSTRFAASDTILTTREATAVLNLIETCSDESSHDHSSTEDSSDESNNEDHAVRSGCDSSNGNDSDVRFGDGEASSKPESRMPGSHRRPGGGRGGGDGDNREVSSKGVHRSSTDSKSLKADSTGGELKLGSCVARLGDGAACLTLAALQEINASVGHEEAASALAVMACGTLQAASARLLALPPTGLLEPECRRAALDMLTQSLQLLPPSQCTSGPSASLSLQAGLLCAHAHLMLSELQVDGRGSRDGSSTSVGGSGSVGTGTGGGVRGGRGASGGGRGAGGDRSQHQRQQRAANWHLDRAFAVLHSAGAGVASALDPRTPGASATAVLLAHLHLAHAAAESGAAQNVASCSGLIGGGSSVITPKSTEVGAEGSRTGVVTIAAGSYDALHETRRSPSTSSPRSPPSSSPPSPLLSSAPSPALPPSAILHLQQRQRQNERALEEVLAGCRIVAVSGQHTKAKKETEACQRTRGQAKTEADVATKEPKALLLAQTELTGLLQRRMQGIARDLCATESRQGTSVWKAFYRTVLQLGPEVVSSVILLQEQFSRARNT